MPEDLALRALFFGLLSALSLPLGAIAARFWTPSNRALAALMAFGAGALLSALTIDLVGEALRTTLTRLVTLIRREYLMSNKR